MTGGGRALITGRPAARHSAAHSLCSSVERSHWPAPLRQAEPRGAQFLLVLGGRVYGRTRGEAGRPLRLGVLRRDDAEPLLPLLQPLRVLQLKRRREVSSYGNRAAAYYGDNADRVDRRGKY